MSRNNRGACGQATRMQQDAGLIRALQGNFGDILNRIPTRRNILNFLPHSVYGGLPVGYYYNEYLDSCYHCGDDDDDYDDEYYYYDVDQYSDRGRQNTVSGHSAQSPLNPHPCIKQLTSEEAEKHAETLLEEENRLKEKSEKKRLKKLRQRERKRLEKENADKDKLPKDAVKEGHSASSTENKEDMNIPALKKPKESIVGPDPDLTKTDVTSCEERHLGEDDEDETREEESLSPEPEELDMTSCFISTAAAIAEKQLGKKNKPERKHQKNLIAVQQEEDNRPKMKEQVHNKQFKREVLEKENADKDKLCAEENRPQMNGEQVHHKQEVKEVEVDVIQRSMDLANTGNQFAARGQLDVAVKYFTDAIKYNPTEYRLFGNRSFCYEKLRRFDLALIDAELALGMNPGWVKGLFRKGKALCGQQRYFEAALTYKEVLRQDSSSVDASQELWKVEILQLMEMGFTHKQSSEALKAHSSFEAAVNALSGIEGEPASGDAPEQTAEKEEEWTVTQWGRNVKNVPRISATPTAPASTPASAPASARQRPARRAGAAKLELFPVWVGSVVSTITEQMLHRLFSSAGEVFSIKMMPQVQCAFVHYTRKQDCETAIQLLHGFRVEGVTLSVRHPNKIRPELGVSINAATDSNIAMVCPRRKSSPPLIPNNRTISRAK